MQWNHIGNFASCNTIKSRVLSRRSDKFTVGMLGSDPSGYRQLTIAELNGTTGSNPVVKQVISTHVASDFIQFTADGYQFIAIANTYDSSEEAMSISMTVPVAVYR